VKTITVTELRNDTDNLLDEVLESGMPVEIDKDGKKLRIVSIGATDKLQNLIHRPEAIIGDPEELVHMTWPTSSS
jgi:prevent-host-death family protein